MSTKSFLSDVHAVVLEQGLGKARSQILTKHLEKHGGKIDKNLSPSTTHVLVGKTTRLSRIPALLKVKAVPENVLVVRADWLSACLVEGEKVGYGAYLVHSEPSPASSPSKDSSPVRRSPRLATSSPKQHPPSSQTGGQSTTDSVPTSPDKKTGHGEDKSADSASQASTSPSRPAAAGSLTSPKVSVQHTGIQ